VTNHKETYLHLLFTECISWPPHRIAPQLELERQRDSKKACSEAPRAVQPTPGSVFGPQRPMESATRGVRTVSRESPVLRSSSIDRAQSSIIKKNFDQWLETTPDKMSMDEYSVVHPPPYYTPTGCPARVVHRLLSSSRPSSLQWLVLEAHRPDTVPAARVPVIVKGFQWTEGEELGITKGWIARYNRADLGMSLKLAKFFEGISIDMQAERTNYPETMKDPRYWDAHGAGTVRTRWLDHIAPDSTRLSACLASFTRSPHTGMPTKDLIDLAIAIFNKLDDSITEVPGLLGSFAFFHLGNSCVNTAAFLTLSLSPLLVPRVRPRPLLWTKRPMERIPPFRSRLLRALGPRWRSQQARGRERADRGHPRTITSLLRLQWGLRAVRSRLRFWQPRLQCANG